DHLEARDARELEDVAAVAGLGELGDAPDAANAEQGWLLLVPRMRDVRLDHANQAVAVAERVIHHREIALLENVERHLAARQQQRARQRKYRDYLGKVGVPEILGVVRNELPRASTRQLRETYRRQQLASVARRFLGAAP